MHFKIFLSLPFEKLFFLVAPREFVRHDSLVALLILALFLWCMTVGNCKSMGLMPCASCLCSGNREYEILTKSVQGHYHVEIRFNAAGSHALASRGMSRESQGVVICHNYGIV